MKFSNRQLTEIIAKTDLLIVIRNQTGQLIEVVNINEKLLSFDPEVTKDLSFLEPNVQKSFLEIVRLVIDTDKTFTLEYPLVNLMGEHKYVSVLISKFQDNALITVHDITERHNLQLELYRQATNDALTGCLNQHWFIQKTKSEENWRSLILIDLDGFKSVNDAYGHQTGDSVLIEVSNRLREHLKSDDQLVRYGGDEFVILTNRSRNDAFRLCKLLKKSIENVIVIDLKNIHISASFGISHSKSDKVSLYRKFRQADSAMYRGKRDLETKIYYYLEDFERLAKRQSEIDFELRHSLNSNQDEFKIVYQPIVQFPENVIVGYEALIRWQNKTLGGQVTPDEFISRAEITGDISKISAMVADRAIAEIASKRPDAFISINVSPTELTSRKLIEQLIGACRRYSFPLRQVFIEITERTISPDTQAYSKNIKELHKLGIGIKIDDFGTGYASLSQIAAVNPDVLKIDRSMIPWGDDEPIRGQKMAVLKAVIAIAESKAFSFGLTVEGVESAEQLAFLYSLGFRKFQGYYFGKPDLLS